MFPYFDSPSFIISFRADDFNTVEVNLPIALASAMTSPRMSSSVTLEINTNYEFWAGIKKLPRQLSLGLRFPI